MFAAAYIALRSIVIVELLGIQKLTNAFGLCALFQGVACVVGSPLSGKSHYSSSVTSFCLFEPGLLSEYCPSETSVLFGRVMTNAQLRSSISSPPGQNPLGQTLRGQTPFGRYKTGFFALLLTKRLNCDQNDKVNCDVCMNLLRQSNSMYGHFHTARGRTDPVIR